MRIREIITELQGSRQYRETPISSLSQIEQFMADHGFRKLGGGEFGLVFERGNDVVKLYNDACYEHFIAVAKANAANPAFPKFHGNSIRINDRMRMIRIERLTPLPPRDPIARQADIFIHLAKNPDEEAMWDIPEDRKDILAAIKVLVANLKGGCQMDMHHTNVMLRGDVPVIIDPYMNQNAKGWGSGKF